MHAIVRLLLASALIAPFAHSQFGFFRLRLESEDIQLMYTGVNGRLTLD
jgi:hypothetical protein